MPKKIITIDEEKCIGCGLCAKTCKQSAIEMVNGKAKVTRDDYCDGIGNCLPVCPVQAISFTDQDATPTPPVASTCPGRNVKALSPKASAPAASEQAPASRLQQWPVQIKLVPEQAPYFDGCHLLIAADCTAYAYGNFHQKFMQNKITLIGCPKLDMGDYSDKLCSILTYNNVKSVTVVRMEVPCCGGIEQATITALQGCGKFLPWQVVTISVDGQILDV